MEFTAVLQTDIRHTGVAALCRRVSPRSELMLNGCRNTFAGCACCSNPYASSSLRPFHWKTASYYAMLAVLVLTTLCFDVAYGSVQEVDRPPIRYPDKRFREVNMLFDHTVTCTATANDIGHVFPSETWSCYNIRVDDLPVRSCYSHAVGLHSKCENEDGHNDFGAICRHLLKLHNVKRDLKAALIVPDLHVSSGDRAGRQKRMVLSPDGSTFSWQQFTEQSGRLKDLRCMLTN
jgi:hypothetical protein